MIQGYKNISIVYGGKGRRYADDFSARLQELSEADRYPIKVNIINEKILTYELLSGVIDLFKESEFCVVFLTEEDTCLSENGEKMRLRQNVVFELGMALIELGRERCILMSDFDYHSEAFELPSDMNSLSIKQFSDDSFEEVIQSVINKLLKLSKESIVTGIQTEEIPQYDHLLNRSEYRVDYENIFSDSLLISKSYGNEYLKSILSHWLSECRSLPHFDEKCIYLLERLGFLPIFGKIPDAVSFLTNAEEVVENYHSSDVAYYKNNFILNFARNLVQCVIEYTLLKTRNVDEGIQLRSYKKLLSSLEMESLSDELEINPLMKVIYYDYVGLTAFRIYNAEKNEELLKLALDSFSKALEYVIDIDLSLRIWEGFLTYNLARALSEAGDYATSEKYYLKAINVRSRWLKSSNYNATVRNALSYEYFIAKISYMDMSKKYGLMTSEELQSENNTLEGELNAYSNDDEQLNQLINIRNMIECRKKIY